MATTKTPVSGKAYGATIGTILLGVVTFILTTYVPYFHHVLPPTLAQLLPVICAGIGAFAGAWLSKHQVTPAELGIAVTDLEKMYAAVHPLTELKAEVASNPYFVGGAVTVTGPDNNTGFAAAVDPTPPELQP